MNRDPQTHEETLTDALNAFVASTEEPTAADLTAFIRRYPHFRQELTDFAVGWSQSRWLAPSTPDPIDEEALIERAMGVVASVLERQRQQEAAVDSPPPRLALAGVSIQHLAELAGLSPALWRKLDRRLLHSIPTQVVARVAEVMRLSTETIERYLSQPPALPANASYRAERAPQLSESEDFFDAVRGDLALDDERRRGLLALRRPDAAPADEQGR